MRFDAARSKLWTGSGCSLRKNCFRVFVGQLNKTTEHLGIAGLWTDIRNSKGCNISTERSRNASLLGLHVTCMEQRPFWEANSFSASQYIPRILLKLKFHFLIYKSLLSVPTIRQTDPIHATHPYFRRSILILFFHLRLGLSSSLLPSGFLHQNPVHTSTLPHTCYMPCPSQSPWFNHSCKVWWGVKNIKLLVM